MMYECKIPWSTIYSGGFPPGATMGIVATLTGFRGYDGADAMPNQSVEPNGDGEYDNLDVLYVLNLDANGDGVPESGWHPDSNTGAQGAPPQAEADGNPKSGAAPLSVQFEGIGTDPDGGTVEYHWEFGDGASSEEQNPLHVYENPGDYVAVLTVTDDEGDQTTAPGIPIHVVDPSGTPTLDLTLSKEAPDCMLEGDLFDLRVTIENPGAAQDADLYVLLDVFGSYFFYPTWGQDVSYESISLPESDTYSNQLLTFTWPAGAGSASGINFYAAIFSPGTFDLIGNFDAVSFCFE